MSLYKQIMGLITVFLLITMGAVLWFVLNYNKESLAEQLGSNAKNSANFLGLSISKNVDIDDIATIDGMISSVVDNGFYEYITLYDIDDNIIIKKESPKQEVIVPTWFSNLFNIDAPQSSSNIMNGWSNKGTLSVKVDQDFANNQMWLTFLSLVKIFIVAFIVLWVFLYLFLTNLLKPLKKLSLQAKAIDNNEFIIEKNLPNTIEFKNVVLAMNKTINKMEKIFNKEVETLNKYNELLYKDKDTKLGNKNYLLLKLDLYLKNSHGVLVFLEIKDEISFKKKVGFKNYMALKRYIIELISEAFQGRDFVFSKLDDGVLAALLPHKYYEDIEEKLIDIDRKIAKYIDDNSIKELFDIKYAIGASNYNQNSSVSEILSKTDQALLKAMKDENININYLEDNVIFTKQGWIELLEWAFENDGINFVRQKIVNTKEKKVSLHEYFIRLIDKDNVVYAPGDFLSIVDGLGWMPKLEKNVFTKIFNEVYKNSDNGKFAINISVDFIKNKKYIDWLVEELNNKFNNSDKIFYFECLNADIISDIESYTYFAEKINTTNHKIAIESFTFDNDNLEYLKIIKPAYIKISKSYLVGESNSSGTLINISSTIGAFVIAKHVETEEEYKSLINNGISYLQGKFIDKEFS